MELEEFVSQTLLEIIRGVLKAQAALDVDGISQVNEAPYRRPTEPTHRMVDFDVAVTLSKDTSGGGGIRVAGIQAGAEGTSSESQSSRIKFSIPITLPEHLSAKFNEEHRQQQAEARAAALARKWS